jgi:hypothetical protein
MSIVNDINRLKIKLSDKARRNGLYENFGEKEVRELKDKYDYNTLIYGSETQRKQALMIDCFEDWCMDFNCTMV